VELNGVLGLALGDSLGPQQGPESLQYCDSSTTVVVRTRRSQN
jgi:hypothetical protein